MGTAMNAPDALRQRIAAALGQAPDARAVSRALDVVATERAAAYREAAAELSAWAAEGLLNAPEYGSHENVLDAADRLRARADQMEQQ